MLCITIKICMVKDVPRYVFINIFTGKKIIINSGPWRKMKKEEKEIKKNMKTGVTDQSA